MKKYLELMVKEINNTKYFSLTNSKGTDQGNHNYIVHNNFCLESTLLENQVGYIATLANSEPNNFIYEDFLKSLKENNSTLFISMTGFVLNQRR